MPRSPDLAIFVLTTDDRRQTKPITLPLAHARGVISRRLQGGESETELVISSSAQGPAKNTTDKDRLDVLLTDDSRNRGNYNF